MKKLVILLGMVLAVGLAPLSIEAAPQPGQWSVDGVHEICLETAGTWYGTTFPEWGGRYDTMGRWLFVRGNYDNGDGNDAIVAQAEEDAPDSLIGVWQEWRDDLSLDFVLSPINVTFVKSDCDPPAFGDSFGASPADQLSNAFPDFE